jgi:primosomal protein N'
MGPDRDDAMQVLGELASGLADAPGELLGPAALFRLRGRHRAQLVVKTDRPREVASRAGRLLAAAAPAMREADLSAVVDVDPQSV